LKLEDEAANPQAETATEQRPELDVKLDEVRRQHQNSNELGTSPSATKTERAQAEPEGSKEQAMKPLGTLAT